MKMKKLLGFLLICMILLVGCTKEEETIVIDGEEVNTKDMVHEHCTRQGTLEGGEVSLNYDIYYTGDKLNLIRSVEKVISSSDEILNGYENAYKSIHEHYKNIEYYEAEVIRGDTTVTSTILINYDKINIQELIDLEGEEDNIFENKEPKVSLWKAFAEKLGTKCEVIEEEV